MRIDERLTGLILDTQYEIPRNWTLVRDLTRKPPAYLIYSMLLLTLPTGGIWDLQRARSPSWWTVSDNFHASSPEQRGKTERCHYAACDGREKGEKGEEGERCGSKTVIDRPPIKSRVQPQNLRSRVI